jgi:hypothetical protein
MMRKIKLLFLLIQGMVLIGLLVFFYSCESPASGETGADLITITDLDLTGKIIAPVKFNQITTGLNAPQYTGTIAWETEAGGPVAEPYFATGTEYKAVITLRVKTGYTFGGIGADSFAYSSYGHNDDDEPAGRINNEADSGIIAMSFPATAGVYADTMVTLFSLDGKVPAPVPGEEPATTLDTYQYSGTIAWINNAGFEATGSFGVATVYSAVIILTAKTGYTFAGTPESAFVHGGAESIAHDEGSNIVRVTFPETASGEDALVDDLSLDTKIAFPRFDELPVLFFAPTDQYRGVVEWQTEAGVGFEEPFGAAAVYRAVLTLTARLGWTFSGLEANAFRYAAASSVANGAGSNPGTMTVTVTFPKTMPLPPSWTRVPAGTTEGIQTMFLNTQSINGIAYGNGKYIAVGDNGKMASSMDGAAWYAVVSGLGTSAINSIIYDGPPGGKMFVVGINSRVATSPDGTIWTERIASGGILGAYTVNRLCYASAQEKFFAFAGSKVASSPDGETWTACPDRPNSNAVAYLNGKFVSISFNSTDGSTWTEHEPVLGGVGVRGMAYGGPAGREKYVAVGNEGAMAWSEDGEHWTQLSASVFGLSYIYDIAYGGGIFLAAGQDGKMAYSVDGMFWKLIPPGIGTEKNSFNSTDNINCIVYLNGKFLAGSSKNQSGTGATATAGGKIAYSAPYNEGE